MWWAKQVLSLWSNLNVRCDILGGAPPPFDRIPIELNILSNGSNRNNLSDRFHSVFESFSPNSVCGVAKFMSCPAPAFLPFPSLRVVSPAVLGEVGALGWRVSPASLGEVGALGWHVPPAAPLSRRKFLRASRQEVNFFLRASRERRVGTT